MRSFAYEIRRLASVLMLAAAYLLAPGAGKGPRAGEMDVPKGAVILTIAGKIGNWNRGPFDPLTDGFHKHHRFNFDRALIFDRETLKALSQGRVEAHPPILHNKVIFDGPKLSAILEAAGAKDPKTITFIALDGYTVELKAADLGAKDWVLALEADGKPLGIGQQGLTWLVHTPAKDGKPSDEEFLKWGWAIFYIEVQ